MQMTDLALSSNWTRTLASQAGNTGSFPVSVTTAEPEAASKKILGAMTISHEKIVKL